MYYKIKQLCVKLVIYETSTIFVPLKVHVIWGQFQCSPHAFTTCISCVRYVQVINSLLASLDVP